MRIYVLLFVLFFAPPNDKKVSKKLLLLRSSSDQENANYTPAGIDRDVKRFQGLGAILLWLAYLVQPSRNHSRRENTDRTHLPNL